MHNKDWISLDQKTKERLLHSIGKSAFDNPVGYEVDKMMKNYQAEPSKFNNNAQNSQQTDHRYKGSGPGYVPK